MTSPSSCCPTGSPHPSSQSRQMRNPWSTRPLPARPPAKRYYRQHRGSATRTRFLSVLSFNPADFFPSFFFFPLSLSVLIDPKGGKSLLILNLEKIRDRAERACQDRAAQALSPGKVTTSPREGGRGTKEVKQSGPAPGGKCDTEENAPVSAPHPPSGMGS